MVRRLDEEKKKGKRIGSKIAIVNPIVVKLHIREGNTEWMKRVDPVPIPRVVVRQSGVRVGEPSKSGNATPRGLLNGTAFHNASSSSPIGKS